MIGELTREGEWFVARCSGLPILTQGRTDAQAIGNLIEATQLFIESCIERGTFDDVKAKYRWCPSFRPPQDIEPRGFVFPVPLSVTARL
jgi:hypothetical protein